METARIGRRIAYWRERRAFTQDDFGRLMGQTRRWVQSLEGASGSRTRACRCWCARPRYCASPWRPC